MGGLGVVPSSKGAEIMPKQDSARNGGSIIATKAREPTISFDSVYGNNDTKVLRGDMANILLKGHNLRIYQGKCRYDFLERLRPTNRKIFR